MLLSYGLNSILKTASFTAIPEALPASGDTIRNWIIARYQQGQVEIAARLQETDFRVHFSFDLWTSPNYLAFFGVVGHWISSTGDLVTALLEMEHFRGPHTGANQAQII